ncbi:glycosyltransferase family 4 protein [Klebsiella variicola]|uniref:glycosyltransferase family 4 protein n=1 Tax=Klebsiella variicola TaxID=244366 RepID=UPI000D744EFC|nr:glycosyltransferase family 4 protein [Klebsiella variicola]PXK99372.1 hypothetical protein DMS11_06360 [Klebsiella variicola]PXL25055.1 hypothetical protein DMS66_01365 [Klebsiella variicola]PXL49067.1 hypothetical protein DMS47_06870 [Klebsiella variicola]PXL72255.1 hypothetical protein DMS56_05030 [Klebsiella variicola]
MKKIYIPLINLSNHGGVRILVELANYLADKGWDVEIIVPNYKYDSVYKVYNNKIKITKLGPEIKNKKLRYLFFLTILPLKMKSDAFVIANFFPTYFPSIVWGFLQKGKVVYFIQDIESKYEGVIGSLINKVCNLTYSNYFSDFKITANIHLKKLIENFSNSKVSTINIGLSDSFVKTPRFENNNKYDIVFFLRREEWKRPYLLKEVLLALKDKYNFNPSVLAVSQDKLLLEEYNEFLNASISPKDDLELIRSIDSAKLLLFTSSKEGFGLPPLECMSRGLPAIIFECGGPGIYAEHESNAIIVDDKDTAADYLYRILNDTEFYSKLSAAAQNTAITFSNQKGFFEFNSLLNEIAQKK